YRATIDAEALTVTVSTRRLLSAQVKVDAKPPQTLQVSPEQDKTWTIHEAATLDIPNLVSVELARGKKRLDIEHSTQVLERLDREFREVFFWFGEKPDEDESLNRLAER